MDNRQTAREWLERNGLTRNRSQWAQDRDREALTAAFDSVRREAMEEAADECSKVAKRARNRTPDACEDAIRALAAPPADTK